MSHPAPPAAAAAAATPVASSPSTFSVSTSGGPQLVVRIGVRELLVSSAVGLTALGLWHAKQWNDRRLLARDERRKARQKEWMRIKKKAADVLFYSAALAAIGAATYVYTKAQNAWQTRNQPRMLGTADVSVL